MTWRILLTVLLFSVPTFFALGPWASDFAKAKNPGNGAFVVALVFLGAGLASVVSVFWLLLLWIWS